MAIRDKIVANAQPHLQPGERVQAVFSAQTTSQFLILAGVIPFLLVNKYRTVVATDRRILVFNSGKLSSTKAKTIVGELPRDVMFGPPTGTIWHPVDINGERLRIHRRFHKDVEAMDRRVF